jgi:hypothetical protein
VRAASVAELAAVPKITPKLAQRIHDFFHKKPEAPPAVDVPAPPEEASPEGPEGPSLASRGDLC